MSNDTQNFDEELPGFDLESLKAEWSQLGEFAPTKPLGDWVGLYEATTGKKYPPEVAVKLAVEHFGLLKTKTAAQESAKEQLWVSREHPAAQPLSEWVKLYQMATGDDEPTHAIAYFRLSKVEQVLNVNPVPFVRSAVVERATKMMAEDTARLERLAAEANRGSAGDGTCQPISAEKAQAFAAEATARVQAEVGKAVRALPLIPETTARMEATPAISEDLVRAVFPDGAGQAQRSSTAQIAPLAEPGIQVTKLGQRLFSRVVNPPNERERTLPFHAAVAVIIRRNETMELSATAIDQTGPLTDRDYMEVADGLLRLVPAPVLEANGRTSGKSATGAVDPIAGPRQIFIDFTDPDNRDFRIGAGLSLDEIQSAARVLMAAPESNLAPTTHFPIRLRTGRPDFSCPKCGGDTIIFEGDSGYETFRECEACKFTFWSDSLWEAQEMGVLVNSNTMKAEQAKDATRVRHDDGTFSFEGGSLPAGLPTPVDPGPAVERAVEKLAAEITEQITRVGIGQGSESSGVMTAIPPTFRQRIIRKLFPRRWCESPDWTRNTPPVPPQHEEITRIIRVEVSVADRLRLLVTGRALLEIRIAGEHEIGRTVTTSAFSVIPPAFLEDLA